MAVAQGPAAKWYPPGTPAEAAPAAPSGAPPVVLNARIGEHQDRTRFVIEVSDPLAVRVFTLTNPDRVVIDLPQVLWRLSGPQKPTGTGAVKSYRYGLFRPGDSRFVIDLNAPATPSQAMILPPSDGYGYRIVVDLFPASQAKFDNSSGWPADLRAREAQQDDTIDALIARTAAQEPAHGKKIIVIDPGHGGIDSGTICSNGSLEKDLVLDEGKRLAKDLKARGYT
ncbi:MAG: N-acetylmuramoyl-L-alanine amidase, partial [Terriglobia bacterium]